MSSSEVSPRESGTLAAAAASRGPWKTAGVVGLVGAGAAVGVDLVTLHWSLGILAGPASIGLFLFFLVGGAGAALSKKGGDHRLRRWAAEHPWQASAAPAAALAVTNTVTQYVFSGDGIFASIFTGLWHAAILYAIVGVVSSVAGARRRSGG
ncbi:hypothetical protein [Streptacidiphilus rugosus]|uniref:hypothetical protein n=1 Tax=Streptacidiphilus rugosus TaxID=405783 RepID=UPI00056147C4|nr:hypothetical protein [Streptacidiphilus rugosus]